MKTDLFQSCGHCWVFQICWHIECSNFTASSFRIYIIPQYFFKATVPMKDQKIKSDTFHCFPIYFPWSDGTRCHDLSFLRGGRELYKKDLHDPDNHRGVITHLEPDILEREVKWALGSIATNKASGSDGIPVELFQTLKDDAMKVLHSICQKIWKTQQWSQD